MDHAPAVAERRSATWEEAKTPSPKIAICDLDFTYGATRALKKVNLDIAAGAVTAIIGASGCGKSTLLRVLNRIYAIYPNQAASGEVLLDGQNILAAGYPASLLRAKVGMVFQRPVPFPMSIYENVAYALRHRERLPRAELDTRVEEALRKAALWDEVRSNLRGSGLSLSGGQQQRLCIARAIALKPEVILLDEPTSALDPIAASRIEEMVLELSGEFTLVIVTHSMQQAARISDYTAFMHLGELIEFGETDQIFQHPSKQLTEDYITGRFG